MTSEDYEAGVRDGRLKNLESSLSEHKDTTNSRLSEHEQILKRQERILWMLIGAVGLIQFLPLIKDILK